MLGSVTDQSNDGAPRPTVDEILAGVRYLAQLRAIFMPPPPPPPPARLTYAVTDATRLPMEYLLPDLAAISALADNWSEGEPVPHLDGVRFEISTQEPKPCQNNLKTKPSLPRS